MNKDDQSSMNIREKPLINFTSPTPIKKLNKKIIAIGVLVVAVVAITCILSKYWDTERMGANRAQQAIEMVKVLSPKDGDKFGNAVTHYIKWRYSLKENLTISLCSSIGCKIIASEVPNSGQFDWNMSNIPDILLDESYYFEVYPSGARERAGKSGTFTVVSK